MRRYLSLTASVVLLAASVVTRTAAAAPPASAAGGAVMAKEDTMHTEVPPVFVSAPRVTLDEILDRVARGEARRDSMMHDQSFMTTMRAVGNSGGEKAQLLMETVARVYKRRPDRVRTILLRQWELKPDKKKDDDDEVDISPNASMSEEIVNFAFSPSARREFKYRIVARDIVGDHLIYRIAFEPRSALDVYEPSGLVWVDTKDFVIVRQEISFRQSPVPLFLKGIRRMVIERQKVGDYWVLRNLLMRVETTIPVPKLGRVFDFGIQQSDYVINSGLPDSVFAGTKPVAPRSGASVRIGVSR